MYLFASMLLSASFLVAVIAAALIAGQMLLSQKTFAAAALEPLARIAQGAITLCMSVSSAILLAAFINCDFAVEYVAHYSDRTLPLFYRITAFWAGQSGSMLFWAWSVAIGGALYMFTPSYRRLSISTRLWFWLFFFLIMAFFMLVLTAWSNPFITLSPAPADGRGLNPLLQNPGMIFHPPLLFLGYGGFVVPGCLALAQTLSGKLYAPGNASTGEESWGQASRTFIFTAWSLLTAGIILGAWWAYMELGWGGYWAWDPVENASLIPWLVASAYLHTAVIESRRGKLHRTNVFLMALTTISAFFATYLVRSGVVESLHAFGDGGVGTPLLLFTLVFLYIALFIALCAPQPGGKNLPAGLQWGFCLGLIVLLALSVYCAVYAEEYIPFATAALVALMIAAPIIGASPPSGAAALEDLTSKEGLLVFVAWLLLALSCIILIATMWPVIINGVRGIAHFLPEMLRAKLPLKPMGLEPAFYNRVCLPLFAFFAVLLLFCPFRKWKISGQQHGFTKPVTQLLVAAAAALAAAGLYYYGITQPLPLLAASCAVAAMIGLGLYFAGTPGFLSVPSLLGAHGTHLGLLMIVLGIAFSGPYQVTKDLVLAKGESGSLGDYYLILNELYEGESQIGPDGKPNFHFLEAELLVADKDRKLVGKLSPQRRLYANFENQTYAEVSTIFSLKDEVYATLLSVDDNRRATMRVNINPLINWLWIGGVLMCLFPFLSIGRVGRVRDDSATGADSGEDRPAAEHERPDVTAPRPDHTVQNGHA